MPTSAVNGALLTCCSYCCGDLLVGDGGDATCRYCGNLVHVHAPPSSPTMDAPRRMGASLVVHKVDRSFNNGLSQPLSNGVNAN